MGHEFDVNVNHMLMSGREQPYKDINKMENRTARLTILIDPRKKKIFEEICAANDLTPSQVVRKLIREYIIDNAGSRELPDWLKPNSGKGEE